MSAWYRADALLPNARDGHAVVTAAKSPPGRSHWRDSAGLRADEVLENYAVRRLTSATGERAGCAPGKNR